MIGLYYRIICLVKHENEIIIQRNVTLCPMCNVINYLTCLLHLDYNKTVDAILVHKIHVHGTLQHRILFDTVIIHLILSACIVAHSRLET